MEYEKNWWIYPEFKIKQVASGFKLAVNIAFVPKCTKTLRERA